MKHRISITVDKETVSKVRDFLRCKTYRNKSHLFEMAVNRLINEKGGEDGLY